MVSLTIYQNTDNQNIIFLKARQCGLFFIVHFLFDTLILKDVFSPILSPFNAFPKGEAKEITKTSFTFPILLQSNNFLDWFLPSSQNQLSQ